MQIGSPKPTQWEKALYGWLLFCALLPIYGSWLNLNFAALQPDHLHIYGDEVELDHHQEDELLEHKGHGHHDDEHAHHGVEETAVSENDPSDEIAYLPNLNSLLLILTAIFLTLLIALLLWQPPELMQPLNESIQAVALVALIPPSDPPRG